METITEDTPLTDGLYKSGNKLVYIDNIKVLLTVLVVMHHAFVTYGAPGSWYYNEKTTHIAALIPMTLFVAVNQSFFMGFFFFIAAYFTPASYDKKGALKFTLDRLKRLGIPLLFYSFIFSPVLSFIVYRYANGNHITYLQYLGGFDHWVDFGVLWFVAALLLFSLVYMGLRLLFNARIKSEPAPGMAMLILFALALGIISYLVRIPFPVGWVLQPVGFQLGHFTQYIALFIAGVAASRGQWLSNPEYKTGKRFALLTLVILLLFPLIYYIKILTNSPIETFNGAGHWQSAMYAVWEQLIGISIIVALLGIFKRKKNIQSAFQQNMGRAAFAVYIFHPLVLIILSVLLKPWSVDPSIKVLLVAPLAVIGSFLFAFLLLKIKLVRAVV